MRGLTVVEVMNAAHDGTIKGMYIMGENPAMSDPNLRHVREALASLDHLVVQELFLTETACYADVVLPASAWPEKDGTVTNTNRQVRWAALPSQCLTAPGRTGGSSRRSRAASGSTGTMAARPMSLPRWQAACPRSTTSVGRGFAAKAPSPTPVAARTSRPRRHLRRRLSDPEQAGQARARGNRAAGRIPR